MKFLRQAYKGVSWRNPLLSLAFSALDIPDAVLRRYFGLSNLPSYSSRVRSRGVANQLGGRLFHEQGLFIVDLLRRFADLNENSDVLEIGCGCGCAAIPMAEVISGGSYRGVDIDQESIADCRANGVFAGKRFDFEWLNVYNKHYNPNGIIQAREFEFAYEDQSADIVFLVSVFTHMLPPDVAQYISEIGRMLRPGGVLVCSVFLMDYGISGASISFPYVREDCRLHQESIPERAVGYYYEFFEAHCSGAELIQRQPPLLGNWRDRPTDSLNSEIKFGQDILIFEKQSHECA